MKFSDITSALVGLWTGGSFGLTTVWPNTDFEPTPNTAHARVAFIFNQPEASSVGAGGLDAHSGVMQVDLMYPTGVGIGSTFDIADDIAAVFKGGTIGTYNSQQVHILSCGVRQPVNQDGFLRVTVSIAWVAYVSRG